MIQGLFFPLVSWWMAHATGSEGVCRKAASTEGLDDKGDAKLTVQTLDTVATLAHFRWVQESFLSQCVHRPEPSW